MEKKRLTGITLFGISLLYFPIMFMVRLFYMFTLSYRLKSGIVFSIFGVRTLISVAFFILIICIIAGILKLKKWALYTMIPLAVLSITTQGLSLFRKLMYISEGVAINPLLIIEPSIVLCYFMALIYYFTRPKVKEQFK